MGVVLARVCGDDKTGDVDLGGLEVCREIADQLVHGLPRGNTIVADQWKRNDEDLAAVGRIGYGLRIADHTSLEDQFAGDALVGTKAVALVGEAILQLEADDIVLISLMETS